MQGAGWFISYYNFQIHPPPLANFTGKKISVEPKGFLPGVKKFTVSFVGKRMARQRFAFRASVSLALPLVRRPFVNIPPTFSEPASI